MVKIVLHTEQHPEDNAMLQALYSRSAESVDDHISKVYSAGSGKFMSQYYLGYGHASIADCGFITVYIEGVSMICAKAIQDNPLYNGQESSSRYIDWSSQPFHNPYNDPKDEAAKVRSDKAEKLLQAYRNFYISQKPIIIEHLTKLYPKKEDEKQTIYDKAIIAKSFDILRGFLPCGATTNVSWTTSLRKANEHLAYLSLHPLKEVREVTKKIHAILLNAYPNSINSTLPEYETADPYLTDWDNYYSEDPVEDPNGICFSVANSESTKNIFIVNASFRELDKEDFVIEGRQRKYGLPKHDYAYRARLQINFLIDFGSYRDLQRHRNGYCSVPIMEARDLGFHSWYYNQLPEDSKNAADLLFNAIEIFLINCKNVEDKVLSNQYLLPMGTLVPITLDYDIHQALYVAELRSSQTVHATLRPVAQAMGNYLEKKLGISTYCDFSDDIWNTRRGSQDIIRVS